MDEEGFQIQLLLVVDATSHEEALDKALGLRLLPEHVTRSLKSLKSLQLGDNKHAVMYMGGTERDYADIIMNARQKLIAHYGPLE